MKQKLTCSVAMTTYNGEKYVVQQMSSIMHQSHAVDEVKIIDDGCQDDTVQIIQNFISENSLLHWTLICNDRNLGYTKNFEKCISKCHGDVIFLCDQDDIWVKDKVDVVLRVFCKYPNCKSVVSNFRLIDDNNSFLSKNANGDNVWYLPRNKDEICQSIYTIDTFVALNNVVAPGCTQAFRKDILELYSRCNFYKTHDYIMQLIAVLEDSLLITSKNTSPNTKK